MAERSDDTITDEEFDQILADLQNAEAAPQKELRTVSESDSSSVLLDPTSTIAHARELHGRLCSLVDESGVVTIDASQVEKIDTAAVQLIYAFLSDRENRDASTRIREPSGKFVATVKTLCLDSILEVSDLPCLIFRRSGRQRIAVKALIVISATVAC